jgi:hypothetical protein
MEFFGGDFGVSLVGGGFRKIKVDLDTIDRICVKARLRVDYLAMDVEGAEKEALEGAKKTLCNTKKVVIGAYHMREGSPTWPWVTRYLKNLGFRTKVTEDGLVHGWKNTIGPDGLPVPQKLRSSSLDDDHGAEEIRAREGNSKQRVGRYKSPYPVKERGQRRAGKVWGEKAQSVAVGFFGMGPFSPCRRQRARKPGGDGEEIREGVRGAVGA